MARIPLVGGTEWPDGRSLQWPSCPESLRDLTAPDPQLPAEATR